MPFGLCVLASVFNFSLSTCPIYILLILHTQSIVHPASSLQQVIKTHGCHAVWSGCIFHLCRNPYQASLNVTNSILLMFRVALVSHINCVSACWIKSYQIRVFLSPANKAADMCSVFCNTLLGHFSPLAQALLVCTNLTLIVILALVSVSSFVPCLSL